MNTNNNQDLGKKLNIQICCICLEEEDTQNNIENDNKLVEYNHCGKYYIHNKCLNKWKSNECIICRKNLNNNKANNESNLENNDLIRIISIDNDEQILRFRKFYLNFCFMINFLGILLYFFVNYY